MSFARAIRGGTSLKFLFVCRDIYAYDYPLHAQHLAKAYGVECHAITLSTKTTALLERDHPNAYAEVFNLDAYFNRNGDFSSIPIDEKLAYLSMLEGSFGVPSLSLPMYLDRQVHHYTHDDWITLAFGIGKFLEEVFRGDYSLIISEIGTTLEIFLWHMAQKRGIPSITPGSARFRGRMSFRMGAEGGVVGLQQQLAHYRNRSLTDEDYREFEEFYGGVRDGSKKPEYANPKRLLHNIKANVAYYRRRNMVTNKSRYALEPSDFSSIAWLAYLRMLKAFNTLVRYPLTKIFASLPDTKYIYYPLHVDPETATLLYGPFYVNQIAVIQYIAKSIPVDTLLVVKEHPYIYGHRAQSFYDAIKMLPNVALLHTLEDNMRIIAGAEAIVTITGTAGFEAILHGKPVFLLGDVFYKDFELVRNVDNIKNLAYELRNGLTPFQKDNDTLIRFALAYLKSTYPGVTTNAVENPSVLEPENVANVAAAIHAAYRILAHGSDHD
jgi:hypothetical protein